MPQAQTSRLQVAYIPEVTFGVTPGTPQTQVIEVVNYTPSLNTTQLNDPSIRSDRQVAYSRRGNIATSGDLEVVMCPDNYDELLQAVCQGTWTANVLTLGTTQRSFAIERGFLDLGQFEVWNGCVFNSFSMEVVYDQLVTATFGFLGSNATAVSGTSIDVTPTLVTAKDKFFHEGGTFKEGGVTIGTISSISFELNNNVSANNTLGTIGVRSMTSGQAVVNGSVTAVFEDATLYNKYKNDTSSSIELTLVAGAETLKFELPKIKYGSGAIETPTNAGVMVQMEFQAIYDTTAGTTLKITRV